MVKPQTKTAPKRFAQFGLSWFGQKCGADWVQKISNRIFAVWVGLYLKPHQPKPRTPLVESFKRDDIRENILFEYRMCKW